jgi:hypothetical protein
MREIKKFRTGNFINDVFDDLAYTIGDLYPSWTFRGKFVDTDKFDITPKPKYYEEQINRTQDLIDALDRQHDVEERYYQERRKRLLEDKEKLLRDRDNK